MANVAGTPLRILCIHGYRQNAGSFREKTGALRKLLKKQVDLVYTSAPHSIQKVCDETPEKEMGPVAGGDEDPRGWWFSDTQARSFNAGQQCRASLGLEESVEAVRGAVRDQGPFDGVLGFSQGAALVAMLCSLQAQNLEPEFRFRFAILVAGFPSACEEHGRFYDAAAPLPIPSLHVFGLEDRVIPDSMSRELLRYFKDPLLLTHPGGHFVPAASAHRQTYQEFLRKFQ
ncbi:esterase OVCA2 [Aplochiton taeniatus]